METISNNLLTVEEAAALLKVPKSWVYERTRTGALPMRRLGARHIRIPRDELLAWVDEGTAEVVG